MSIDDLAGIPGSLSDEARRIRWIRHADMPDGARCYQAATPDGTLAAIVSRDRAGKGGKPLWHLSVSHRGPDDRPDRCPNWEELKHAAYRLIPEDVCLVLIFPRRSAPYVNHYETCLHLWQSEREIDV
jgi:hypothetical protein